MKLNFLKENYIKTKTETFCKTKVSDHAAMSGTHTDYVTLKSTTEPLRLTVQVASWYMLGFTHDTSNIAGCDQEQHPAMPLIHNGS